MVLIFLLFMINFVYEQVWEEPGGRGEEFPGAEATFVQGDWGGKGANRGARCLSAQRAGPIEADAGREQSERGGGDQEGVCPGAGRTGIIRQSAQLKYS